MTSKNNRINHNHVDNVRLIQCWLIQFVFGSREGGSYDFQEILLRYFPFEFYQMR